jgi:hypothetical protein
MEKHSPTWGSVPPTWGSIPPTWGSVPPTWRSIPPTWGSVSPTWGSVPPLNTIFHLSGFLKDLRDKMIQRLKKQMPELKRQIDVQGKRVKSNAFIKFAKKDGEYCDKLHAVPVVDGICLTISATALLGMDKYRSCIV